MVPCRRKIGLLIQSCLGAFTVGVAALSVSAQSTPNGVAQGTDAAVGEALRVDSRYFGDRRRAFESNLPPAFGTRGSPPVGGGCQTNDPTNGQNYGVNFNVADNFNAAASGSLTAVSWSAVYQGTGGVDVAPPATETFRIRFFNDNAGLPGTQLGGTINLTNPTRTNSGTTLGASIIWDYQAAIAGPAVTSGTCYWIEIKNTTTLGTGVNTFWVQGAPFPGDAVSYQSFGIPCQNYQLLDQTPGDVSFCLNIAFNTLDGLNCPTLAAPTAPCTNPLANGNGLANNLGTGYNCVSVGSTYTGTARFQRAEVFRVSTGGTINQICFWGFFLQQVAGGRTDACIRDFDVIVWALDPATLSPLAPDNNPAHFVRKVGVNGVTVTSGLDNLGLEQFSVSLPGAAGIPVNANTCYGLTVSNLLNSGDANRQAAFAWGGVQVPTTPNPVHDNRFWTRSISTAGVAGTWGLTQPPNTQTQNLSFLLNVGPMVLPNCVPPPANDACAGAINLPLTGTPVSGTNVEASADAVAGCGFQLVERPAVWFTFVGTGNDVTVTTCNAGTPSTADTMIGVYCANDCNGPFNCVGANDDATPACGSNAFSSTVTVPTVNGQRYYVLVYNPIQKFVGTGFVARSPSPFQISATQGAASTDTTTCALRANCVVDNDPFDIMETDACGTGTADTNNTCATAVNYPTLGLIAKGVLGTTGSSRDFDMWRLPASAAGQNVEIRVQSESPVIIQVQNFNPDCTATATVVAGFALVKCIGLDTVAFEATLPATGVNIVLILPPSFDGLPCPPAMPPIPENSQNDYRLQVDVAALGACCLLNLGCFPTTFTDCADQSTGEPTDFWAEGVGCTPDPCISQPGKCCFPDASCQVVPSAGVANSTICANQGGTYTAGGTCTPNTCPSSANIACCEGATCRVISASACTGPNTLNSMASACNVPGNGTMPCCKADYNHIGGVGVQDIFDFLAGYFSNSPFADVNGGGIGVQDIFDYLALYFQGCP